MIKGSEHRQSAHAIDIGFIDRWSARAMSGEAVSRTELMMLFEAARWAPSSMNFQPWRMLYALRGTAHWPRFMGLLHERNREWAEHGGALVLFLSRRHFDDGRACATHSFDTGAAWENFALQGSQRHLVVRGVEGFDHERARRELEIPGDYHIETMAVVGWPGDAAALPERLRARERPNDRRPLSDTVREGSFSF